VQHLLGRFWGLVLGPLLILLGVVWPGWLHLPLPTLSFKAKRATTLWGAFGLGVPFSVAICPFCTPALVVLLGVVATLGSPLFSSLLLLAFALGRAVPILLGAVAIGWLESLQFLKHCQKGFDIFGGTLLILSGLYLLNAYFHFYPFYS
jgi:cytochrome c-type biogenesis protein